MENIFTYVTYGLIVFVVVVQIYAYRHDIKWFLHRLYFGKDHLNRRKNVWFTGMTESYSVREKYVRELMSNYHLSAKECVNSLKLLSDSKGLTLVHDQLLQRLVELKKVRKFREQLVAILEKVTDYNYNLIQQKVTRYS